MKRTILLYGLFLAALVLLLKLVQYRYFIHDLSIEFYGGTIALLFVCIGAWVGARLTSRRTPVAVIPTGSIPSVTDEKLKEIGLSRREFEVLELMCAGNSNQEIADKLFLSLNTVKTHAATLFVKLDVRRRTQAVAKGKELRILS